MTQVYKVLAVLLEYPRKELVENWDEMQQIVAALPNLAEEDKSSLTDFIASAADLSLTKLQAQYVDSFDMTAENSLYLTYHLFDEQDRDRGPALIELSELYKSTGFEINDGELPDYLPLILEYVSTMDDASSAHAFLQQTAQAADIIASNLEKNASPYAPLVRIVEHHGLLADIAA
ncbi:MAG: nitrate reductase molybdenum cofactor assembly chaperone NarJ/NarW [Methyloprofundus sp.]|nr:MAG: nitrate reductase molybdenum cofactor assembly chaperone NarJ/NarW [Methyloprofundus sp.]